MIKPFKFIVQTVLLELDVDGNPIGEKLSEPSVLYGVDAVREFLVELEKQIEEME
jgi:hypothetical protein